MTESEIVEQTPRLKLTEYHRSLEMEREVNAHIKASFDLGEVDLGNGEKVALSIVQVDDFPVETSEGRTIVEDAYLFRQVFGSKEDDLTEFRTAGNQLELSRDIKDQIVTLSEENNLSLQAAVGVATNTYGDFEINAKQLDQPPVIIGMTGKPGKGKTKLLTYLKESDLEINVLSFDDAGYFNLFTYAGSNGNETASSVEAHVANVRKKGKLRSRALPHYGTKIATFGKLLDDGAVTSSVIFVDLPPDWRERAKRGVAPDPHVFDVFSSGISSVLNIDTFIADGETVTPDDMDRVKEMLESDDFTNFIDTTKKRDEKIALHVLDVLKRG